VKKTQLEQIIKEEITSLIEQTVLIPRPSSNKKNPLLKKNKSSILENIKLAKQLVQKNQLTDAELKNLIEIDPHPKKAFVGWMAKIWVNDKPTIDNLRNKVEEYYTFLQKGKAPTKDIYQFKTFADLSNEVDELNKKGTASLKDLEEDYEVIIEDSKLTVYVPHTHEASRKLGLTTFKFRHCEETGKMDSAWCTTYKTPDHFNDYYYVNNVTFYYIRVNDPGLQKTVIEKFGPSFVVMAIAVLPDGRKEGYEGKDERIRDKQLDDYLNTIGLE
jgi:hypothetical protein